MNYYCLKPLVSPVGHNTLFTPIVTITVIKKQAVKFMFYQLYNSMCTSKVFFNFANAFNQKSDKMKKFIELKTLEKGNVIINVNHIISIESITNTTSKILLAIPENEVSYYTIQENIESVKRKLWEMLM